MNRDVRTLLFCRLTPNQTGVNKTAVPLKEAYANLVHNNENQSEKHTFFAFGGYSAICVYKTPRVDETNWLESVYEDKQRIIAQTKPNISFHQMHLVSHVPSTASFWKCKDEDYPLFATTLVYGAKSKVDRVTFEGNECSAYEHIIREHLKGKEPEPKGVCYAVYNGIGISDVVILWRANNYEEVSNLIASIEAEGVARQTITTMGFPLDENGKVKECATNLFKGLGDTPISVSVRGNVRNWGSFKGVENKLIEALSNNAGSFTKDCFTRWNFGKYDFDFSINTKSECIPKLIDLYETEEPLISEACWEIYTDLHVPNSCIPEGSTDSAPSPTPILNAVYGDFLRCNPSSLLQEHAWASSMMELMSTHHFIDQHPVLHGPSYLIYHSLCIVNAYLRRDVTDYRDEEKYRQLLARSENSLNFFVRSWDQLTEQITRNDDAILNNRSNTHTIHLSLPESALDFYHAFVRLIVRFLVKYDEIQGCVPEGFEFDFLLSPQNSTRFRFLKLFQTNHKDRADTNSGKIWPQKQAYILELPLKSVFSPLDIFIPVVHECFHCFGDQLRKRSSRLNHMIYFVAISIASAINCGTKRYRELVQILVQEIRKEMQVDDSSNPYLIDAREKLRTSVIKLFSLGKLDTLFLKMGGRAYYLYSDRILDTWLNVQKKYETPSHLRQLDDEPPMVDSIVEACVHYFKECYADAMTIALLKLTPQEYLERITDELKQMKSFPIYNKPANVNENHQVYINRNTNSLAQRFAVVLVACCGIAPLAPKLEGKISPECRIFTVKDCRDAISKMETEYPTFSFYLRENFEALSNLNYPMPSLPSSIPLPALHHVVEYLISSIDMMVKNAPQLELPDGSKYKLENLRKDFEAVIRNGDMFGRRFYEIIYYHHQDTKKSVKESQNDHQ